jgi:Transmembrane secretion effector
VIAGQIVGNELAGPAAGGWLFGLAAVLPFAVNAGTLGIAVLLLLTLPSIFQSAISPGCRESATSLAALRQDLSDGLKWLHRHSSIRDVTIAVGVIAAMDAAWFAVLVLYVTQILGDKPTLYGLLLATGAIGGIAVGGKPHITRRLGSWRSVLMAGLVMAASQIVLGLSDNVIIAAAMLAASSASLALFNMTAITMRQRQVPDYLLGRITSLYRTSHKVQRHLARSAVARSPLLPEFGPPCSSALYLSPPTRNPLTWVWRLSERTDQTKTAYGESWPCHEDCTDERAHRAFTVVL